jgi:hypothetical protein
MRRGGFLFLGLVVLSGMAARADIVACSTLATLDLYIATGSTGCTVGDKTFYDFSYASTKLEGTYSFPAASSVTVTVDAQALNPGLTFTGPWVAYTGGEKDSKVEFDLNFIVTSSNGFFITDSSLFMVASDGYKTEIKTKLRDTSNDKLKWTDTSDKDKQKDVDDLNVKLGDLDDYTVDPFNQYSLVKVYNEIKMEAKKDKTTGTLTSFSNYFSQTDTNPPDGEIPEPSTLLLGGSGILFLLAWSRSRRRKGVRSNG